MPTGAALLLGAGAGTLLSCLFAQASLAYENPMAALAGLALAAAAGAATGRRRPWAAGAGGLAGFGALAAFEAAAPGGAALALAWLLAAGAAGGIGAALDRERLPAFGLGAAAGCAASGLWLGAWGWPPCAALALSLTAGAGIAPSSPEGNEGVRGTVSPFLPALAFALLPGWSRALGLFLGSPLAGFAMAFSALAAGSALGALAAVRVPSMRPSAAAAGAAFGGCILGVLALNLLRMAGLTQEEGPRLLAPIASLGDVSALAPVVLLLGLAGAALGFGAAAGGARVASGRVAVVYAASGVVLGACLELALGSPRAVLGVQALLLAYAILRVAWDPLMRGEALWRAGAAACLIVAGAWSWKAAGLWREILVHRLNAVEPGARLLEFDPSGAQLAVATIPGGRPILIREGVMAHGHGAQARWILQLPVLLHGRLRKALILGGADGKVPAQAGVLGLEPDTAESDGVPGAWRRHFGDQESWSSRSMERSAWGRRVLRGGPYDLIAADLPRPLAAPPSARALGAPFWRRAARALAPDGVAALWLPLPAFPEDVEDSAREFASVFPYLGAWSRPSLPGILIIGSRAPTRLPDQLPEGAEEELRVLGEWTRNWLTPLLRERPRGGGGWMYPIRRLALGGRLALTAGELRERPASSNFP